MTKDIQKHTVHEIVDSFLDPVVPLASQSLFWRAHYLKDSPAIEALPLLFWVTENMRPTVAVTLGVADAVPYFALCQAIEKLGLETMCFGIELSNNAADKRPVDLSEVKNHNQRHYADFSLLLEDGQNQASGILDGTGIDLLIVNHPVSLAVQEDIDRYWLPQLSERGIILFLQGGEELREYVSRITQGSGRFTLDAEKGVHLALCGTQHNDRLSRLCQMKIGKPGYRGVRNVFARTGELHLKTQQLERLQRETHEARKSRDEDAARSEALAKQLMEQESVFKTVTTHLKEKNVLLGTVRAEVFDLQKGLDDEKAATQTIIKTLTAEFNTTMIKAEEQANVLAGERDAARAETEEARTALSQAQSKAEEQANILADERDAARAEAEGQKLEVNRLLQDNHTKTAILNDVTAELAKERTNLENRLMDIAILGNGLDNTSIELKSAKVTLEGQKLELNKRHGVEERLQTQVRTLKSELDDLRLRLNNAESSLVVRQNDIATLGNELLTATQSLRKLRLALQKAEHARDEARQRVSSLEDSTSWRLTSPLRKVSLMVRSDRQTSKLEND